MKLSFQEFNGINIDAGEITILQISSPVIYVNLLTGLSQHNNQVTLVDSQYNNTNWQLVTNLLELDPIKLYSTEIVNQVSTKLATEGLLSNLKEQLNKLSATIGTVLPDGIATSQEVNIKALLQLLFYLSSSKLSLGNRIEQLISYHALYRNKDLLCLTNLQNYLDELSLEQLKENISLNKLALLDIEFNSIPFHSAYANKAYWIDNDGVLLPL